MKQKKEAEFNSAAQASCFHRIDSLRFKKKRLNFSINPRKLSNWSEAQGKREITIPSCFWAHKPPTFRHDCLLQLILHTSTLTMYLIVKKRYPPPRYNQWYPPPTMEHIVEIMGVVVVFPSHVHPLLFEDENQGWMYEKQKEAKRKKKRKWKEKKIKLIKAKRAFQVHPPLLKDKDEGWMYSLKPRFSNFNFCCRNKPN